MQHRFGVAILLLTLLLSACATMPDEPVERALYSDLRQVVETRESTGWLIDAVEFDAAAASTLQSVCQVAPAERRALMDWLDVQIVKAGGPAEDAYRASGSMSGLSEALTYERIRGLLQYSHERAYDDCPFYLEPDDEFAGVQTDTNRFLLLGESIGGFALIFVDGKPKIGGGGGGRINPAWGFGDRITVAFPGAEVGGIGSFGDDNAVSASITAGMPFYVRMHDDEWFYDFELSAISRWHDNTLAWPPGVRVGFGLGLKTVRIAGIMPLGAGWIGWEYYPEFRGLPETHLLRMGTRVGASWDP